MNIIANVRIACVAVSLLFSSGVIAAAAEVFATEEGRLGRSTIRVGHSETLRLPAAYADILVGSPDIADVMPVADKTIYILGKKVGTTNVTVFSPDKRLIGVLDIQVTPDSQLIESRIRGAVRGARSIKVTNADGNLVVSGVVEDAVSADRALAIAQAFSKGTVVNAMQIASPQQVLLEVRVVEASRNAGRELGVRWFYKDNRTLGATGVGTGLGGPNGGVPISDLAGISQLISGSTPFGILFSRLIQNGNQSLDVTIQALEEKGLVRRLASPNMTALSGSTANFQAGGEYPVPVSQTTTGGVPNITVQFKKFGIILDFTPTVLQDGQINLKVTPEVSELDYENGIKQNNFVIPGIVVRRTSTEIMLRSGQSFAVAGLMAESGRTEAAQLPWIGSVPVLGTLFKSQSYQKRETELVILVTAHLARPAAPGERLATPLDKTIPPNDLDFFAGGKYELQKDFRNYVETGLGIVGPYGHVLDIRRTGQPAALMMRN